MENLFLCFLLCRTLVAVAVRWKRGSVTILLLLLKIVKSVEGTDFVARFLVEENRVAEKTLWL